MTPNTAFATSMTKTPRKRLKPKKKGISVLMKEADRLFSILVRNRGADDDTNTCFTCGKRFPIKSLHCGHYLSRYYKSARWDFDNARPQDLMCNLWKRGDPIVFRQNLVKEIGEERVLAVEAKRNDLIQLTPEYLTLLIESLKS